MRVGKDLQCFSGSAAPFFMLCRRLVAVCGNDLLGMRGMFSFVRFLTKIVSMRKIAALLLPLVLLSLAAVSCRTGYALVGIDGGRVAVDSSFDLFTDDDMIEEIEDFKEDLVEEMSPVIGSSAATMRCEVGRDYNVLANTVADMVMDEGRRLSPDVAFAVINVGGLRKDLPEGPITVGTAFEILPFENTLCIVDMPGEAVTELFEQIARLGGEGVSAEVRLTISRDGGLLGATVAGKEVDAGANYRVVTIDYVAEGNDGMRAFKRATRAVYPDDEILRDVFIRHVAALAADGKAVQPKTDRRIFVN